MEEQSRDRGRVEEGREAERGGDELRTTEMEGRQVWQWGWTMGRMQKARCLSQAHGRLKRAAGHQLL
jgi:hypothetical protein